MSINSFHAALKARQILASRFMTEKNRTNDLAVRKIPADCQQLREQADLCLSLRLHRAIIRFPYIYLLKHNSSSDIIGWAG